MKLIDKDALVAEIERLRKEDGNPYFPSETADKYYARGVHFTCDGLINFLDTLEVKETEEKPVSKVLEDAIEYGKSIVLAELEKIVKEKEEDGKNYVFAFSEVKELVKKMSKKG